MPVSSCQHPDRRPGLASQALERLEEMIITVELEPGSLWTENALSALTGFGRTPVREALKRLEASHLVTIVQRHGIRITEINIEKQLLLLETRRELERLVSGRAARRRSSHEIERFHECADALRQVGRSSEIRDFFRVHARASLLARQACRNPFAAAAIQPCHAMSRRFYYLHHREARDLEIACDRHADIMDAIARGDEPAAIQAADSLLDYVEGFTRATLSGKF